MVAYTPCNRLAHVCIYVCACMWYIGIMDSCHVGCPFDWQNLNLLSFYLPTQKKKNFCFTPLYNNILAPNFFPLLQLLFSFMDFCQNLSLSGSLPANYQPEQHLLCSLDDLLSGHSMVPFIYILVLCSLVPSLQPCTNTCKAKLCLCFQIAIL